MRNYNYNGYFQFAGKAWDGVMQIIASPNDRMSRQAGRPIKDEDKGVCFNLYLRCDAKKPLLKRRCFRMYASEPPEVAEERAQAVMEVSTVA